jgi:hypothetical protein
MQFDNQCNWESSSGFVTISSIDSLPMSARRKGIELPGSGCSSGVRRSDLLLSIVANETRRC